MKARLAGLFRRWLSTLKKLDIGDGKGAVFFTRYDVLKTRIGSLYLHEFHRSDVDRCMHDHPWWFVTLILRGGYVEELPSPAPVMPGTAPNVKVWRGPGYVGVYPAEHIHRIELAPGKPKPWSLVWVGRKTRSWGFWGPTGWKPWRKDEPNPICETA